MEVVTQTLIDAPRAVAWAVLSDLASWGQWQDTLTDFRVGEITPGASLTFRIKLGGPSWSRARVDADILWVRPGAGFAWMGPRSRLLKRAMAGEHWFTLEDRDSDSCVLHHGERFTGAIAKVAEPLAQRRIEALYADFNRRFAQRVQGGQAVM